MGVEGIASPLACPLHSLSFMLPPRMPVQCSCHLKGTHQPSVPWQEWFRAKPRSWLSRESKDGWRGSKLLCHQHPHHLPLLPGPPMQWPAGLNRMKHHAGADEPLSLGLALTAVFRGPELGCLVPGKELWQVHRLQGAHFIHMYLCTHTHTHTLITYTCTHIHPAPESGSFVHPCPWPALYY